MRVTRINTASSYHLDFFGIAPSRTDLRFDTVEVWGSSPHGPTIVFNHLESFLRNPRETSPVILHLQIGRINGGELLRQLPRVSFPFLGT